MATSRLARHAEKLLLDMGFTRPLAYQPWHLFVKNGRRHERVAEPHDPWLVSAIYGDRSFSVQAVTPADGANAIMRMAVMPELHDLAVAVEALAGAIRCVSHRM